MDLAFDRTPPFKEFVEQAFLLSKNEQLPELENEPSQELQFAAKCLAETLIDVMVLLGRCPWRGVEDRDNDLALRLQNDALNDRELSDLASQLQELFTRAYVAILGANASESDAYGDSGADRCGCEADSELDDSDDEFEADALKETCRTAKATVRILRSLEASLGPLWLTDLEFWAFHSMQQPH